MRILGLDYGEYRIGVSICDPFGLFAYELEVIKRIPKGNIKDVLIRLKQLMDDYDVSHIVLGFPKNMNNTIGPLGESVIKFKEILENKLGVTVSLWDERLSSKMAENILLAADLSRKKRKQVIDKMSAVVILQGYLDWTKGKVEV